jgi:hypothetical protein
MAAWLHARTKLFRHALSSPPFLSISWSSCKQGSHRMLDLQLIQIVPLIQSFSGRSAKTMLKGEVKDYCKQ